MAFIVPGRFATARAARMLHGYMTGSHLEDGRLGGDDDLGSQGCWLLANWRLSDLDGRPDCDELAIAAAEGLLRRQADDGGWHATGPQDNGRLVNAHGTWAAICLLETYRRTEDERYLNAGLRWHDHLEAHIEYGRYAAPRNSALTLRLLGELTDVTGDDRYLRGRDALLLFLMDVQRPSGELPYQVAPAGTASRLEHFRCFLVNAAAALDLARFEELTGDARAERLVSGAAAFLADGIGPDGNVPYACDSGHVQVTSHIAVVSAALGEGARRGVTGCADASAASLAQLLALQDADGGFPESRGHGTTPPGARNPRDLAVILLHALDLAVARVGLPVLRAV